MGFHRGFTRDGVKMGITSDYVDFCLGLKYKDLPVEVVDKVKQLGLDYIGTAAYGTQADSSRAMSILKRSAFIEEHADQWLHNPKVLEMIQRIYCHHDPKLDKLLPEKFPARAVIKTKDGRKLEAFFERPYGDGLNPMPYEEVSKKCTTLASSIYLARRVKESEEKIRKFEKVQNFGEGVKLLAKK